MKIFNLFTLAALIAKAQSTVLVYSDKGKFQVNDRKSSLIEDDGNTSAIFDAINNDDHNITHGRVYGVLTDGELSYAILSPPSLSKRDDGDVYEETKCSSTACNININVVSFLYNTLAPFTSFLDTSSNITLQNISSAIKNYSSDACGYGVLDLASLNDDKWNIAISAFSAADGCGTSATEEEIQCAMTQAITAEQNHKMVAYCVRLDHAGTWNTDVRIQRRRDRPFPGIWNMPCDDVNEDLPVNDYCVA